MIRFRNYAIYAIAVFSLSLLFAPTVFANSGMDFAETEKLISKKLPCAELSDEQLEQIGDYYMEQMHPGVAHEQLDQMMGGEGSESLRQMHRLIARRWYCGDAVGLGMMGMMMGQGMMGGFGMMPFGWHGVQWTGGGWITMALVWLFLIAGIAAFIRFLIKK